MSEKILFTGVSVEEQMERAKKILNEEVLPKEELYQKKKKQNKLSKELISALKANA